MSVSESGNKRITAVKRRRGLGVATRWLRHPPLAVHNVLHGGRRSVVAVAGMALAVVMVLLQLGFLRAPALAASVNYDQLDFDLAVLSTEFEQFYYSGEFPRERLEQARSVPGVAAARPLWAGMNLWRCPPYPLDESRRGGARPADALGEVSPEAEYGAIQRWWLGSERPRPLQRRALLVIGYDPDYVPFLEPVRNQVAKAGSRLRELDRVLLSSNSHPDFGWQLWPQFQGWELGSVKVDVIGPFSLTRSLGADGAVLCTAANFAQFFGLPDASVAVNFGLLSLEPGADPASVAGQLRSALPPDVQVLTRDALYEREGQYWVGQTPSGQMFSFGVLLTMAVAAVVVYQELSNDIRNHLPEYATLKAIGYGDSYLIGVILAQAGIYAMMCFPPAVALSLVAYRVTANLAGIPMEMTERNLLLALLLIALFGQLAGIVSLRKLRRAEPAELFG